MKKELLIWAFLALVASVFLNEAASTKAQANVDLAKHRVEHALQTNLQNTQPKTATLYDISDRLDNS